ncbi:MAG: helix-turn-helix domain-containing protein [Psychromonas sp.]
MKKDSNEPSEIIVPLGQALKDARIVAALSIEEVAEKLNLSFSMVRDIEDDLEKIQENKKYSTLYLRGYLVNYAKLVGLTTLELFVEFQQLNTAQKKKENILISSLMIPRTKKRSHKTLLFITLMMVVGVIFYLFQKPLSSTIKKMMPLSDVITEYRHLIDLDVQSDVVINQQSK